MATDELIRQLFITGDFPRVTKSVTLLAGQVYPKGAVLGRITASDKYTLVDDAQGTGEAVARLILAEEVDATLADTTGVGYLTGQFNEAALTFGGNDTADDHRDALEARSVFLETTNPV